MTGTATLTPEARTQAQPRERVCVTCGMRSRFLEGFEPNFSGWEGGLCPHCAEREAIETAREATREEQEARVLKVLQQGVPYVEDAARKTGVPLPIVRQVKRRALAEGLLTPPKSRPPRLTKAERAAEIRERGRKQAEANLRRDLAVLQEAGTVTRAAYAVAANCAPATATGRLRRLTEAGLATREPSSPHDRRLVTWRAAT